MALTKFSHGPSKVAKSIRKKKGPDSTSSLHANSRDARKLTRATLRDEKLYKHALIRDKANEKYLHRVSFFKVAAESALEAARSSASESDGSSPFDSSLLARLITAYLSRYDAELSSLASTRRPGRPASTRETALRAQLRDETNDFESGFWIPDLRDESTRTQLVERWDGGWSSLATLRFVRVCKPKDEHSAVVDVRESKFPPKGDS